MLRLVMLRLCWLRRKQKTKYNLTDELLQSNINISTKFIIVSHILNGDIFKKSLNFKRYLHFHLKLFICCKSANHVDITNNTKSEYFKTKNGLFYKNHYIN